jgi:hypothetical protein
VVRAARVALVRTPPALEAGARDVVTDAAKPAST